MVDKTDLKSVAVKHSGSTPEGDTKGFISMNEHIEYFKRFANCYLKWSHSNFDRIVKDAIKRQELVRLEEIVAKERLKYKPIIDMFKATNEMAKNG